jgi:FAD/FMN-containing dehydrogenase
VRTNSHYACMWTNQSISSLGGASNITTRKNLSPRQLSKALAIDFIVWAATDTTVNRIVREANERGRRVRVVGATHSFSKVR